jgi:hypothetical protein
VLRLRPILLRIVATLAAAYIVVARPGSGVGFLLALGTLVAVAAVYGYELLTESEAPPPARSPVMGAPVAPWMETFYPEVADGRDLADHLNLAFAVKGMDGVGAMEEGESAWSVTVAGETRRAEVGLFTGRRGFVVHVEAGLVEVGDLVAPGLDQCAAAVADWLHERVSVAEWIRRHPSARLRPCAALLDEGRDAYVACRWERLRTVTAEEGSIRRLLPVYDRARAHPVLGRMEPVIGFGSFTLADAIGSLPVRIEADAHGPLGFVALWEDGRLRETAADGAIDLLLAELPATTPPEGETHA